MGKLPKRVSNVKAKEKRARSWARNQEAKKARIKEQETRAARNRELGTTAKQRANQVAKIRKDGTDAKSGTDSQ